MRRYLASGLLIATLGIAIPASAATTRKPVTHARTVQQPSIVERVSGFVEGIGKRLMGPVKGTVGGCSSPTRTDSSTFFGPG
jgi:hypothetical protein